MEQLATAARPLRIAIIGAGLAGLYAAEALLKQRALVLTVDIFNRFPTPFGLVRDGVAPEHQAIKAVIRVFDKVLADPRVRFFGNVTYGVDIHHEELKHFYDQIIYTVGAQADRRMGIPGEESPNSLPATAFVGWYNGHPRYHDLSIDLSCERAVVVGNGNVAMDVTRMLVMSPDVLMKTDIAAHALKKLPAYTASMAQEGQRSIVTDPILAAHIARHQDKDQATIGVMVMALGTPAGPDDIKAYYTHMRGGHPPSPELLSELQRRYAAIGGRSPLLEHTQAQARGLQAALDQADPGRFRVTLGMQHSRPFIEDSLAELVESGVQQVVGLVLAPHYSRLSVGVYSERLKAANTPSLPLSVIEHWHLAPGYLDFLETSLQATLEKMIRKHGVDADKIEVLFTAHSLPMRILAMNDPYPEQVRQTAEAVASRLSLQRWAIAWQSAGRTAEPWIGPALLNVLAELPGRGGEGVVVCSAGFVSDHLEILYDLDIEARQTAERLGLAFERTPMPNDEPGFLAALASVVRSHVNAGDGKS